MPHPDVAAIVVAYNSGATLEACVQALLASSPPLRIVVVDNASRDDSRAVVKRLATSGAPVELLANERNEGFARAANRGMRHTRAGYYALVNPDCYVEPGTVAVVVEEMGRDPRTALASCTIRNEDGTLQRTNRRRFPTPWSGFARTLGLGWLLSGRFRDFDYGDDPLPPATEDVEAVSGAFMVARSSALAEIGLLDEGYFLHCEDLDWCRRAWDAGYTVAFVPHTQVTHRKGGSGRGVAVEWHLHRGMLRFHRKHRRGRGRLLLPLVYAGVWARFAVRAAAALVRRVARRPPSPPASS